MGINLPEASRMTPKIDEQQAERSIVLDRREAALTALQDEFTSAISHEIRTPLTAILGFARTLERRWETMPRETIGEAARAVAQGAERLADLLEELLNFDHLRRGIVDARVRRTWVDGLVRMVVVESNIHEHSPVRMESEPIEAMIDGAKIERIVEIFLSNVVRHTPPETAVWVRVRDEGDHVLIIVEDSGPGVPEAQRTQIFEPFRHGSTTPQHAPGAGMGLAIAAGFVRMHGGRVWVDERDGGGARFCVQLPKGTAKREPS